LIGKKRVNALVDKINQQEPDIVVLVGDMVDDEMGLLYQKTSGKALANIRTQDGVYAVMGNHE
jgi:predicted MPP superfamily phosphohydrolase